MSEEKWTSDKVKFQRCLSQWDFSHFILLNWSQLISALPQRCYCHTVIKEKAGGGENKNNMRGKTGIQGLQEDKTAEWNQEI